MFSFCCCSSLLDLRDWDCCCSLSADWTLTSCWVGATAGWTVFEESRRSNEGGLGGLTLVILGGGGGWTLGGGMEATGSLDDDIEGPVSGVASPGSMASSTTGPTTSLSRAPSLLPFDTHWAISYFSLSYPLSREKRACKLRVAYRAQNQPITTLRDNGGASAPGPNQLRGRRRRSRNQYSRARRCLQNCGCCT